MIIHPSVQTLSRRLWPLLPLPGVVAAAVYLLTLSRGVYPGYPAALAAAAAGLTSPSGADHPLFALAARGAAALDLFDLSFRLNLFAALCGTLCAVLLYFLAARMILFSACEDAGGGGRDELPDAEDEAPCAESQLPPEVERHNRRVPQVAVAGGLAAAFVFIFTAPVWCAATRLDCGLFDLLLALATLGLFPVGDVALRLPRLALSALLFTLGLFDSAVFLLLLPVYAVLAFRAFWFSPWRVAAAAWLLAAGAAGAAFAVFAYSQNVEAAPGLFALLTGYARVLPSHHYRELLSFFPRSGWALVAVQTGVPALILLFGQQTLFKERRVSTLLAVALVVLAATPALLNLPVAPFFFFQPAGHLPVFGPALLAAAFAAALAAGLLGLVPDDGLQEDDGDDDSAFAPGLERRVLRVFMGGLLPVLLLLALATPWRGFREADTRRGQFADEVARAMLDAMKGRTWLVSNGYLDNHLLVQAALRKQPLTLVTLRPQPQPQEAARLGRLIAASPDFAGQNRLRLQNALTLGTVRFVREWFAADRDAGRRAMVFALPDIWTSCGYAAVPEGLAFGGARPEAKPEMAKVEAANQAFAGRILPLLAEPDPEGGYVAALREMLRMKAGLAANELGVMLEEAGQSEAAYQAYTRAGQIDPMNISAAVNGYALASAQKIHPEALDRLDQRIRVATADRSRPVQGITGILQNYGTIRQPGFYQQQAALWTSSGARAVAADKIRKALALTATTGASALVENAFFYVQEGAAAKGEVCYAAALEQEPANRAALSGLCMLMLSQRKTQEAETWIRKSREAGVEADVLLYPEITLAILKKENDRALALLAEATKKFPADLRYWTLLADVLLEQGETQRVEHSVLPAMQKALKTPDHFLVHAVRGFVLRKKGSGYFREARLSLLRALSLNASMPDIWSAVFELDMALGKPEFMETDARNLLNVDPEHVLANYLMGASLLAHGKLREAEDFLRRSIEKRPTAAACNDLAEDLRLQNRLAEAEVFARQALGLEPGLPPALDTLACILTDAGNYVEAARTAAQAVEARPGYAPAQLTLLRAKVLQSDYEGVRQRLSALADTGIVIPEALQNAIRALK